MANHADTTGARSRILYCASCGKKTTHSSSLAETGWKLTLVTLGLYMPVWVLQHFFSRHWHCRICSKRRRGLRNANNPF